MSRNPDFDAVMIKQTELEALRAEIQQLRAALAEIAAHDDQFSSPQQARAIRDAARRALEPKL